MTNNKAGNILVFLDYEVIFGRYLKVLLDFCFNISDSVSLTESYNTGMTKDEYRKLQNEFTEYKIENGYYIDQEFTEEYMISSFKENGMSEEEINEFIKNYRYQALMFNSNFKKTDEEVRTYVEHIFSKYILIERKVTCITPCTSGSPTVMYYFELEDTIKELFYNMDELFHPVIRDEENSLLLDDPVLYKRGEIILSICSHEQYGSLYLNEAQYTDFKKLGIPHLTKSDRWWDTEDFPVKYSINIRLEDSGIVCGLLGDNFGLYETLSWEDRKNIFNSYKNILKPNRISVIDIIDTLKERYILKEFTSDVIEEQIKRNVYETEYYARQIKGIHDMDVLIYELDYNHEKIIIGAELNSEYIFADMPSVIEDIKQNSSNDYCNTTSNHDTNLIQDEFYSKGIKHNSILYKTYDRERLTEKCCSIIDEINVLRGLDEFELRNDIVVNNYLRIIGMIKL